MKYLVKILFLFFALFAYSAEAQKYKRIDVDKDSISFIKVNLEDILDSLDKFNNAWVEIEGKYKYSYEFSGIFPSKNPGIPRVQFYGLWVDFKPMFFQENFLDRLSELTNKTIKIRGRIDNTMQGHLGKFPASITNIYYVEEL